MMKSHQNEEKKSFFPFSQNEILHKATLQAHISLKLFGLLGQHWQTEAGAVLFPVLYGALRFSEQAAAASQQKFAGACPTPRDYLLILTYLIIWGR